MDCTPRHIQQHCACFDSPNIATTVCCMYNTESYEPYRTNTQKQSMCYNWFRVRFCLPLDIQSVTHSSVRLLSDLQDVYVLCTDPFQCILVGHSLLQNSSEYELEILLTRYSATSSLTIVDSVYCNMLIVIDRYTVQQYIVIAIQFIV